MVNEKRLIDAIALRSNIDCCDIEIFNDKFTIIEQINEAPTVDAVEVVRCKDCKHFVQGEPYDPCECMKWKAKFGVAYTTPDGYCHKAERKDND